MTCGNCGCFFCWRCNKQVDGYDHFGSGSCVLFEQSEIDAWNRCASRQPAAPRGRDVAWLQGRAGAEGAASTICIIPSAPGDMEEKEGASRQQRAAGQDAMPLVLATTYSLQSTILLVRCAHSRGAGSAGRPGCWRSAVRTSGGLGLACRWATCSGRESGGRRSADQLHGSVRFESNFLYLSHSVSVRWRAARAAGSATRRRVPITTAPAGTA